MVLFLRFVQCGLIHKSTCVIGMVEEMGEDSSQHSSSQFPNSINEDSCSSMDVDPSNLDKVFITLKLYRHRQHFSAATCKLLQSLLTRVLGCSDVSCEFCFHFS